MRVSHLDARRARWQAQGVPAACALFNTVYPTSDGTCAMPAQNLGCHFETNMQCSVRRSLMISKQGATDAACSYVFAQHTAALQRCAGPTCCAPSQMHDSSHLKLLVPGWVRLPFRHRERTCARAPSTRARNGSRIPIINNFKSIDRSNARLGAVPHNAALPGSRSTTGALPAPGRSLHRGTSHTSTTYH